MPCTAAPPVAQLPTHTLQKPKSPAAIGVFGLEGNVTQSTPSAAAEAAFCRPPSVDSILLGGSVRTFPISKRSSHAARAVSRPDRESRIRYSMHHSNCCESPSRFHSHARARAPASGGPAWPTHREEVPYRDNLYIKKA